MTVIGVRISCTTMARKLPDGGVGGGEAVAGVG